MFKRIEMWQVQCDRCGCCCDDSMGIIAWSDKEGAEQVALDSDWREIDGKHYCPDCYDVDDCTDDYRPKPPKIKQQIDAIVDEVTLEYLTMPGALYITARQRHVADARAVVFYLLHRRMGMSSTQVGKLFNRSHATVLAAVRRCEEWLSMPLLNPKAVDVIRHIQHKYDL